MTASTVVWAMPLTEGEQGRYYPEHNVVFVRRGLTRQQRKETVDKLLADAPPRARPSRSWAAMPDMLELP